MTGVTGVTGVTGATGVRLYLASRHGAAAALTAPAGTALLGGVWWLGSPDRDVAVQFVVLAVLLAVAAASATLSAPDVALDRTGARPWSPRRAVHLVVAAALVTGALWATRFAPVRFAPAGLVARDVAGLLGLAALGAALWSGHRAWFGPVAWTLPAVCVSPPGSVLGRVLTWPIHPPDDVPAGCTAAVLAAAGLLAFARWGPALRTDRESGR